MTAIRMRRRGDRLYGEIIDSGEMGLDRQGTTVLLKLANLEPDVKKWQVYGITYDPKNFYDSLKEAQELAKEALGSLCAKGFILRKTEAKINQYLEGVRMEVIYTLERSEGLSWGIVEVSGLTSYVAYLLTRLVDSDSAECVERCKLSECHKFFWAPIRRGRRPTYCCERHRVRGSQREHRGTQP